MAETGTSVTGLAHINVRVPTTRIDELRDFYRDMVGLREGDRPKMRSHGYWMYAGEQDVVHLSADDGVDEETMGASGPFNHVAFACSGAEATLQRLRAAGIVLRVKTVPEEQLVQIFFSDPAGVGIELNFRGETLPA